MPCWKYQDFNWPYVLQTNLEAVLQSVLDSGISDVHWLIDTVRLCVISAYHSIKDYHYRSFKHCAEN